MSKANNPVTIQTLRKMKQAGERFAVLTAYDAGFAALIEEAGVEVLLVGDSLGMVIQGQQTTVPVSVDNMVYHTRCVSRGAQRALVMADMPFMSFPVPERALDNAARLMQEGGAHMVKLEGGGHVLEVIYHLARQGIPICGHLGLQPQSVHKLGGYRVQGRDPDAAEAMLADAIAMQEAGADIVLMECVPAELAARITERLSVPTIGIGAGAQCDGQVLVLYDMLGITPGQRPRFARDFMADAGGDIRAAVRAYVEAVKSGAFPDAEHTLA
ncbi:MAG: 3-methyl-2-oxobutanoate hydroxymethyltransferase [Pseudomonadota bacterium]|nr:MAG: 3-methyl-2-oxobutanoate hydroxymethyltransferase [Pseudomonadota bacterium]